MFGRIGQIYWLKADKLLRKSSGVRTCDEPSKKQKWKYKQIYDYNTI